MQRVVAAFGAADGVGAADVGRTGRQRVVAALAALVPIGWIGGK